MHILVMDRFLELFDSFANDSYSEMAIIKGCDCQKGFALFYDPQTEMAAFQLVCFDSNIDNWVEYESEASTELYTEFKNALIFIKKNYFSDIGEVFEDEHIEFLENLVNEYLKSNFINPNIGFMTCLVIIN